MCTFGGKILEFGGSIFVDCFKESKPQASLYFLSHCHTDHMDGLDSTNFNGPLYMSEETLAILQGWPRYRPFVMKPNKVRLLEYDKKTRLFWEEVHSHRVTHEKTVSKKWVDVTMLPSNHVAGSVMFLFENEKRTVLYSGDCRLEPKFVDTIIDKIPKTIDTLYLDCTFLDEKLWTHFPLMDESTQSILDLIDLYPDTTYFYFHVQKFGHEAILLAIARKFNAKIHVDHERKLMYDSLANSPDGPYNPYHKVLSDITIFNEPHSTRFHACTDYVRADKKDPHKHFPPCSALCHRSRQAYDDSENGFVYIKPAIRWTNECNGNGLEEGKRIVRGEARRNKAEPPPSHALDDAIHYFAHSLHSSFTELKEFVERVKPRYVNSITTLKPGSLEKYFGKSSSSSNRSLSKNYDEYNSSDDSGSDDEENGQGAGKLKRQSKKRRLLDSLFANENDGGNEIVVPRTHPPRKLEVPIQDLSSDASTVIYSDS